jgi:hypothetical protein
MGALTSRMLEEIVRFDLGGSPGTPIEFRELVNSAGEWLVAAFPWRWLEGRQLLLRPRASIAITAGIWTEGTKTLTQVGAFTNYSFLSQDTIDLTAVPLGTTGRYEVASRVSADAITLRTSIGAAVTTGVVGSMRNDQIELPTDFDLQSITGYAMTNALAGFLETTSAQSMLDLRSWPSNGLNGAGFGFWALLAYVRNPSGGVAVPRLELWPTISITEQAFMITYRGGWKEPDTDEEVLGLPGRADGTGGWLNALFIEAVKAVVKGHEEPGQGSVDQRLAALQTGVLFRNAVVRDQMTQPNMGPMEGSWLDQTGRGFTRFDFPVTEPIGF